ncbi:ankyrin repeat domain-containing protein [Endozoicomonas sp. ALB115]|uniref:ankyrin repeat domain-containing protein n=1 Tax=Endozoicomonas sp. ALB115 TaxID=3403074 RepID=UPI003BB48A57
MNRVRGVFHLPRETVNPDPVHEPHDKVPAVPEFTEAASRFLNSAEIDEFVGNARAVAAELLAPDGSLVDSWNLPHQLNPFHIACLAKNNELLEAALEAPQWWNMIDQCTAVIDVNELAVTAGDKKMPVMNGDPPLHFALSNGWNAGAIRLINALLSAGKIADTVNNTGISTLSLAAARSNLNVVSELCDYLCHEFRQLYSQRFLMHRTNNQSNLLHHAAQQPDPEVFEFLLKEQLAGTGRSTLHQPDESGKTPVDLIKDLLLERRRIALNEADNSMMAVYAKRRKIDSLLALSDYKKQLDSNDSLTRKYFKDCGYPDGPWQKFYMENILEAEQLQAQSSWNSSWSTPGTSALISEQPMSH